MCPDLSASSAGASALGDALWQSLIKMCNYLRGGTGIGLMIAQALSQNGAKVYITGRRKDKLDQAVQAHGQGIKGELIALQGDVTDNESIKSLVKQIAEKESYIDV